MLRKLAIVGIAALGLAACGGEPHKVCTTADAAHTYGAKFDDDLRAAVTAGKVQEEAAREMRIELNKESINLTDDQASDYCNTIDEMREKNGI